MWFAKLEELRLPARMMPRDVSTRWNSTYDMLNFALEHRAALDAMAVGRDLRKYELDDDEWTMALNLRDTLKARFAYAT